MENIESKYEQLRILLEKNGIQIPPVFELDVYSCTKLTRERFCELYEFRSQFISNPFVKYNLHTVLNEVAVTKHEFVLLNGYFYDNIFYLIITNEDFTRLLGIICFNNTSIDDNA